MKKAVLAAGIFLVLGVLWYVGPLSGQTQQPPNNSAGPVRTRIALLNLTYVIKNYSKYKHFQEEMKGIMEPYGKKDAELRQKLEELRKKASTTPRGQSGGGEELEKQAREIQRQLEDLSAEIKLKLGKRSDDEMRILFMDVYDAAQRYAASHDYDLVLHYNDATTKDDFLGAQNIARKLNTGALMPLYFQANMDISMALVDMLNQYAGGSSPPNAAQGTPPDGTRR